MKDFIKFLQQSALFKLFFIGFLILLLLIPQVMVDNLVEERQNRHHDVVRAVGQVWGHPQTITGPFVVVPYRTYVKDKKGQLHANLHYAYFLPDDFKVEGNIEPEIRSRGMFDVVVYRTALTLKGHFPKVTLQAWSIPENNIMWSDASLFIGISDTRGIREALNLRWDGTSLPFLSGTGGSGLLHTGLHVPLPHLADAKEDGYSFDFKLNLNGNEYVRFTPVGKTSQVNIKSSWAHPSFYGEFLPIKHNINEAGFSAQWQVSHLGRSYPQQWINQYRTIDFNTSAYQNTGARFGVKLLIPVDFYAKVKRSIKYGILFILLTFTTFFLFEILNPIRIHPLQYLLVGFALSVFYVLLLSLSEHIGFAMAYLLASIATIGLIGTYAQSVLKSGQRAGLLILALFGLYAYLYVLLHLEYYALLFGAVGLFAVLAAVMLLTRHIDWYAVKLERNV